MTPDPALVARIQALLDEEGSTEWVEVLKAYKVACRLSRPMCSPDSHKIQQVMKRAAHWHTKALLLERAIRESLSPETPKNNRISDL